MKNIIFMIPKWWKMKRINWNKWIVMWCCNLSRVHSPVYVPHDIPGQILALLFDNTKVKVSFNRETVEWPLSAEQNSVTLLLDSCENSYQVRGYVGPSCMQCNMYWWMDYFRYSIVTFYSIITCTRILAGTSQPVG